LTRREFVSTTSKLVAGSMLAAAAGITPGDVWANPGGLPSWRSATAKSNLFVVQDIPAPRYSLAGGLLPPGPPEQVLRDAGLEALVALMNQQGAPFFRTAGAPQGLVARDSVVVIKVNQQWVGAGSGSGAGRLGTSTDLIKGLIWRILNHPEGFVGEVVVAENVQNVVPDFATVIPANAQDQNQTLGDVITVFQGLGRPVSLQNWNDLNFILLPGGDLGPAPASCEYINGNLDDGYVLLNDNTPGITKPANGYSYPKFRTAGGQYLSMRHGLWDGAAYHPDRLVLINLPVLKKHGMAGATVAWKNFIGFLTCEDPGGSRFTDWGRMHTYFWGYEDQSVVYGLVGRQLSLVRAPDLNLVDAVWVATENNYDSSSAVRCNVVLASPDPFAVDWYASEYVLRPVVPDNPDDSSLARAGIFRTASLVNQKAAKNTWLGPYPYVDFVEGYSGDTPLPEEKSQMNVFLASASPKGYLPAIFNTLLAG
jgi:hypothetical protein